MRTPAERATLKETERLVNNGESNPAWAMGGIMAYIANRPGGPHSD